MEALSWFQAAVQPFFSLTVIPNTVPIIVGLKKTDFIATHQEVRSGSGFLHSTVFTGVCFLAVLSPFLNLVFILWLQLCQVVRLVPGAYLEYKQALLNECRRQGGLRLAQARALIKIDVNKTRKIYDFLIKEGYITKA